MTEVPKIVYDRLRAARPEEAHPDADLLAAFAEQALSGTEREGVLEHLALCEDCREVIAVALPAAEIGALPVANEAESVRGTGSRATALAPHKLIFAWPNLRWAALAMVVLVVAAVLLVRPGKLNQAKLTSENPHTATHLPPALVPHMASPPHSTLIAAAPTDQHAEAGGTEARIKPEPRLSKKLKAGQMVTPSYHAESGMLLAENSTPYSNKESKVADEAPAAPSGGVRVLDQNASAVPSSNEAAEVTAEPTTAQAEVSSQELQTVQGGAPVVKAKPAPQNEAGQPQNTVSSAAVREPSLQSRNMVSMAKSAPLPSVSRTRAVTWTITAGVLQQSLDGGRSWQDAVRADHPLLCYASHDAEAWTGGQVGTLFHSVDNGVTWLQVHPFNKGEALSSDITRIDILDHVRDDGRGLVEIVISTNSNETWSSTDGGKTWGRR